MRNYRFLGLWNFFKTVGALIVCTVVFLFVAFFSVTAFPFEGRKEYYLSSASSQGLIKSSLTILDLPLVRGESICLPFEVETDQAKQARMQELLSKYEATVLKVEEFTDGTSYYCYSARLKQGVTLDGMTVNLHLVVKETEIALGTPLIFGGY